MPKTQRLTQTPPIRFEGEDIAFIPKNQEIANHGHTQQKKEGINRMPSFVCTLSDSI
jgi:hypothetical protein